MNVAHVITRLIIGGAQENTLLTAIGQQHDYGDRVTLITGPGLGPEGSLEDRARQAGIDLVLLPQLRRSLHPARDWSSYRAILNTLGHLKPDIVHTHSSKAGILGRRAAWKLGLPCVHTIHGASFHFGQSRLAYAVYRHAEKIAAAWTDHFISVCDEMTNEYVAAGIAPANRFTTVYSGFETGPFLQPPRTPQSVRDELGVKPHEILIGKVGRLFPLKGHEFLLAAAPEIIRQIPHARFLIVGDGILRAQFEAQLREQDIDQHFIFTGLVPPEQIPELIHAMDVLVHLSQWEGLARVLPQALIAGKPAVTFDVGGAREVIIPEETGFLLPMGDVPGIVDALCRLAADAPLRQRLGERGRELNHDRFRHQTMTRQIREVYARVLGQR